MKYEKLAVALGAIAVTASLPAAADAATKQVLMGPPAATSKSLQAMGADANDFFPRKITVAKGDKVAFLPMGFHTVDVPARGENPVAFAAPTGQKATGVNDAAGAPFWFNGQDVLGFNPLLVQPAYGKTFKYTGADRAESGLPLAPGKPKPYKVRFTKAGTYTYFCDIHPGMKGKVVVKGKRRGVPKAKADKKAVAKQAKAALVQADKAVKDVAPAGTVLVGAAARHGVEHFAFHPAESTVPVGTTLTFKMDAGSYEAHTATAGPGNPLDENDKTGYLNQLAASFQAPQFDPRAIYPSDQPGAPASLTPTLHGNGFWNSGVMDNTTASPLPSSSAVKFDQAGTYTFYCLIHPFMKATVTVK